MINFGEATKALAIGHRVARNGWNGKNMFLFLVVGTHWSFESDVEGVDGIETLSFICMKTADNKLVPWLASQTDILSRDWIILDYIED